MRQPEGTPPRNPVIPRKRGFTAAPLSDKMTP